MNGLPVPLVVFPFFGVLMLFIIPSFVLWQGGRHRSGELDLDNNSPLSLNAPALTRRQTFDRRSGAHVPSCPVEQFPQESIIGLVNTSTRMKLIVEGACRVDAMTAGTRVFPLS